MARHRNSRSSSRPPFVLLTIAAVVLLVAALGVTAWVAKPPLPSFISSAVNSCDSSKTASVHVSPSLEPVISKLSSEIEDNTCVELDITYREPGKTLYAWGQDKPDVWVPDSNLWIDRLLSMDSQLEVVNSQPFATTPIVWGVPSSSIQDLGGPGKEVAWKDLLKHEHKPQFLPLNASTAHLVAATQMRSTLQKDPKAPIEVGLQWRQAGIALASSQDDIVAKLDSDEARGFPLSEQELSMRKRGSAGDKLDAVLPSDPPQALVYTVASLHDTPEAQATRDALIDVLSSERGVNELHKAGFRTTSTDKGPDNLGFELSGRSLANINYITGDEADSGAKGFAATTRGTEVLMVVDRSGSMETKAGAQNRAQIAAKACKMSMDILSDRNMFAYWEFATAVDGTKDYIEIVPSRKLGDDVNGRSHREVVAGEFRKLPTRLSGNTGLYDTAIAAAESMGEPVADRNRIIVVITDGYNDDTTGGASLQEAVEKISAATKKSKTSLNFVGMGDSPDLAKLSEMAKAGQGQAVYVDDPNKLFNVMSGAFLQVL